MHKHLWKLAIPEFQEANALHLEISKAGESAAAAAAVQLEGLQQEYGERLTVTIARRELRKWLRSSNEGRAVEDAVGRLLSSG